MSRAGPMVGNRLFSGAATFAAAVVAASATGGPADETLTASNFAPAFISEPKTSYSSGLFSSRNEKRSGGIVATGAVKTDNAHMIEFVARPELNAKLETIEAKMDGRLARIEDSVQRMADITTDIKNDYREIRSDNRDLRQSISNMKTVIITSAIGAALAIVFGVAAFNAALTSSMFDAFQAGQQVNRAALQPPDQ